MGTQVILLVLGLIIILLSCELFTNGIEWFGNFLNFGDGVVGSIFSAVGTCLPETIVPIIAILSSMNEYNSNSVDIGIGAILGAPFMLSTLAFFITGLSVIIFCRRRKSGIFLKINNKILLRDLKFFILIYSTGIIASFLNNSSIKRSIAIILIFSYIYYIFITVKSDSSSYQELDKLYLLKIFNKKVNLPAILVQLIIALAGIIFGSYFFVSNIEGISDSLGISAMALSLIITPIATELPEKFNSIIWIRRSKDSLALGNISGAMVFQSCIPVAIGIMFTSWKLNDIALVSCILSLVSSFIVLSWSKLNKKLNPLPFIACGISYAVFIFYLLTNK
ncbi:MAG: sodium:calcium antiporter [Bacillota bacterium]|nr:sodium:calcium antiporter [Bacillota bacterium]